MSDLELDFEMAEVPSPEVTELSQIMSREEKEDKNFDTNEERSCMSSPEIIEVCQIMCTEEKEVKNFDTKEERNFMSSPEIVEVSRITSTKKSEVKKLDTGELHNSAITYSDLEEGEIKEPGDCKDISPVCRHFQSGMCWLGENCRFVHVGISSYKMFDSTLRLSQPSTVAPMRVYHPITIDEPTEEPDSWDKGLREAKKLLLHAKLKKDTDLDFEEKQLYQDLDNGAIIRNKDPYKRKVGLADKHKKREVTPEDCSRLKNSEPGRKTRKTFPKELPSRNPKRVRSRTRNRSNSWSPVPPRHSRSRSPNSSSSCSECKASYNSHKSKNDSRNGKSKLERVFSRTFDAPKTSRSRELTTSRRPFPSQHRRRSLSRHSFLKRFIYRSYSKSPPRDEYSKKRPQKHHERSASPSPKARRRHNSPYPKKERSSSPFSKILAQNNAHGLESCSSDMTVSSIKCTSMSASCDSSEENKSVKHSKSPVNFSRKMSNAKHGQREHEKSYILDYKKWLLNTGSKSEIYKKIANEQKEKSTKPVKNGETLAKHNRKLSSCRDYDKELRDTGSKSTKRSASKSEISKKIANKKISKPVENGETFAKLDRKLSSCSDNNKWLPDTGSKSTKESASKSEISKKIANKTKEKSLKPVKNGEDLAKPKRKLSSCSDTCDEGFSAAELELLRYIPTKNRSKLEQRKKKAVNNVEVTRPSPKTSEKLLLPKNDQAINGENCSTKTTDEYIPPKIVYDYGSDTESPSLKLISEYESDRLSPNASNIESPPLELISEYESNTLSPIAANIESPVPLTSVEHLDDDHRANEDHQFPIESNDIGRNNPFSNESDDTAQVKCPSSEKIDDAKEATAKQFDKNKVEPNNSSHPSNQSKKRRSSNNSVERLTAEELELMKYVSIGNFGMPKMTRKNPPLLRVKQKTIPQSDASRKPVESKKVKTSEMSRREQLMQQLEAVELAIAKKKQQAKLEHARLREKKEILKLI